MANRVQYGNSNNSATVAFGFANTAGNTLIAWYMGTIGAFTNSVSDTNSNAWVSVFKMNLGFGNCLEVFICINCAAGMNTVSGSGILSSNSFAIAEYIGCLNTGSPVLAANGNSGNSTPLDAALTYGSDVLVLSAMFNENVDDYLSPSNGQTLIYHETAGSAYAAQAELLSASAGSGNYGFNIGGAGANNVMVTFAIQLAGSSSSVKSWNTVLKANIKEINTVPIANVKEINTLAIAA